MQVLTDAHWAILAPLIEKVRPRDKTRHHDLRRTIETIIWRHQNGAKWRSIPAELGPWWMAAQTFIRWAGSGCGRSVCSRRRKRGGSNSG
jgi:transposase